MKAEFVDSIRRLLPVDDAAALLDALAEGEPTVSVRVNTARGATVPDGVTRVPWCPEGYYIDGERPQFTFDPLWHSGMYYVQDASSMFISHVIRQVVDRPVNYLDLCAAPGGKATAALQALPAGSQVVANEVVPQRALALSDNVTRWGAPGATVTREQPRAFGRMANTFDVIATDVPCSGEGMMRKDDQAVDQWSPVLVKQCADTQRQILRDVWPALKPGGLLIYSTCTFNREENELMLDYIAGELGAESVAVPIDPAWNIAPGIDTDRPCYRFMPHRTRGEGLFMAVLRKAPSFRRGMVEARSKAPSFRKGVGEVTTRRPDPALAYSLTADRNAWPPADVDYPTAIAYLRGEALILPPDVPRGIVLVTYRGAPLGFANNIGSRANNLYPKPWRITGSHAPAAAPRVID